jgi:hypothetical protein
MFMCCQSLVPFRPPEALLPDPIDGRIRPLRCHRASKMNSTSCTRLYKSKDEDTLPVELVLLEVPAALTGLEATPRVPVVLPAVAAPTGPAAAGPFADIIGAMPGAMPGAPALGLHSPTLPLLHSSSVFSARHCVTKGARMMASLPQSWQPVGSRREARSLVMQVRSGPETHFFALSASCAVMLSSVAPPRPQRPPLPPCAGIFTQPAQLRCQQLSNCHTFAQYNCHYDTEPAPSVFWL